MYSVFEKEDVIVRSTHVTNEGSQTLRLEKVYSACLDMDNENFELLNLHGSWARERHIQRRELAYGKQLMSSLKGESSHQEHPFQALVTKGCDQEHGKVYAMHFVYSGNLSRRQNVHSLTWCVWSWEFQLRNFAGSLRLVHHSRHQR